MKINSKILSIPPYISSSWDNIASISTKGEKRTLVVLLKNGTSLEIPHLGEEEIKQIFSSHEEYLETVKKGAKGDAFSALNIGLPLNLESFGNMTDLLQNGGKMERIEIPPEALDKLMELLKTLGIDEKVLLPEGDFPVDSIFTKFRELLNGEKEEKKETEEEVCDEDLKFKEWDIKQIGKNLYKVINPLDTTEEYQVFLGDTIGCTCGHNDCEHLKAVLRS